MSTLSTLRRRVYLLLHRPPDTPLERAKKIPWYLVFDYTFAMSVYFTAIGALIAKLTSYYGFSVGVSTTIATFPALLTVLEFLSNRFFRHLRKFAVVWRLLLPVVLASAFFSLEIGRVIMVIAFFLMCVCFHIYAPSYNAWTVNITQGHIRSNYFSVRDLFFLPICTALTFFFARLVSTAEAHGNIREGFLLLAGIELLFILPSLYLLLRVMPNPTAPIVSRTGAVVQAQSEDASKKRSILEEFKLVLRDQSYRKVLVFHLVWIFFFQFAGFSSVFQIQVLKQDFLLVTVYTTVANVIRIGLIPVLSAIGVKYGWKKVIFICLAMMSLGVCCWIFIKPTNLWLFLPAGIIFTSIPWAGLGIGMFYFQIACTKMETRSVYFSAHAGLSGMIAAIGVLCCNALVSLLGTVANPAYWLVFALWLFGCVATFCLVAITPFPVEEQSQDDALAEQESMLENELAAERAAVAADA